MTDHAGLWRLGTGWFSRRGRYSRFVATGAAGLVFAGVLALVLFTLAGCGSAGPGAASAGSSDGSAALAPDFSAVTLDGQQVSLAGYQGKPVLLVFMASW
jgi:cytochrome oxidase Cu insertion factor (SCO1/SenC/PrrC family)